MITSPQLNLSGERFHVVYRLDTDYKDALNRAEGMAIEQTIEFPADLVDNGDIRTKIFGQIESATELAPTTTEIVISYAWETSSNELTQLLNVIYGNISIQQGIKVVDVQLPDLADEVFEGPSFGVEGLRKRHEVPDRPLIASALKPMGLTASDLAGLAYEMALGGVDIIKDDHGLSNQIFSPFDERVKRCCEAVRKANSETGFHTAYYPNITAPSHQLIHRAKLAEQSGAGGLLFSPGLVGWDTVNWLRAENIHLPTMAHPTFQGTYVLHETIGFSHAVQYGKLVRLSGADSSVFPNYGGRFSFSKEECQSIRKGCTEEFNMFRPVFPAPGGGMKLNRIQEIVEFYGKDVVLLVGGDLYRDGTIASTAELFRKTATRVSAL